MSIAFILITFLFQMSVGMMISVALLPSKIIDANFFRSISFWSWFFTGIGLIFWHQSTFTLPEIFGGVLPPESTRPTTIAMWLFGLLCFQLWFRIRWLGWAMRRFETAFIALVGTSAVIVNSLIFRPHLSPEWAYNTLVPLHFIAATFVLGGFLAGMIFGHFYLMTVDTPKRLLVNMAWILIASMILRVLAFGLTLFLFNHWVRPDTHFLSTLTDFMGHGIFFWQRVLVGLVIPSVVVALIYNTAKIGSNQSATGIMYVAIAFIFIGELAARYLFLLSAIPL